MTADVDVLQVRSGAAVLHVERRGPADGPPVLLVHGYPDDLRTWDLVAERLAEDHRVVTFDLRGMGRSTVPRSTDSHALERLCADIDAVADTAFGGPDRSFHLVGHDWGSIIGWSYVSAEPGQLRAESWTSISAPHLGVGGRFLRRRTKESFVQLLASAYILFFRTPRLPELLWRRRGVPLLRRILTDSGVPEDDPILERTPEEVAAFAVPGLELYRQNLDPLRLPTAPEEGTVLARTLLVVATEDRHVTAPLARASLPLARDASVVEIDAGHWIVRSHPDEVARAIAANVAGKPVGVDV